MYTGETLFSMTFIKNLVKDLKLNSSLSNTEVK